MRQNQRKAQSKVWGKEILFLRYLVLATLSLILLNSELIKPLEANEFEDTASLNMYGMPGIIEVPSATNLPDGQFSVSSTTFGGTIRVNLSFQIFENYFAFITKVIKIISHFFYWIS